MKLVFKPVGFFTIFLIAILANPIFAQPGQDAFVKANRADLLDAVRTKGDINIIVGLQVPSAATPLTDKVSTGVLQKRLSDIASAQARFLSRLAQSMPSHVKNVKYHPFIALQVNEWTLNQILLDPEVISVEEDRMVHPTLMDTPGLVNAINAWNVGYDGTGQTVAVIDTGVDTAHPFLSGKTVAEACYSNPPTGYTGLCPNGLSSQVGIGAGINCPDYNAGCYHGTHVAGIAVGKRNVLGSNAGGMAPGATLIPIQVFVEDCSVAPCTLSAFTSDMILALDHVYSLNSAYKIASVNMSLGGLPMASPCDSASPSLTASINSLRAANIATVIASGNNSNATQVSFPACISSAITVGSTTKQNAIASYSNGGTSVKLLAPGSSIYSSLPGGGYGTLSGTSMATPHVAGAWATVRGARPAALVSDVLNAFTLTGTPILDTRNGLTQPLIQINAAINALGGNIAPTVSLTAPLNNSTYTAPASITLTSTATDSDGTIIKVEFYSGATLLSTSTSAPYSFNWVNVAAGTYTLTAKAYDNAGAATVSAPITVTVNASGRINVAAQINGGVATASSSYSTNFPAQAANNGDRKGANWGAGGGWNDASASLFPDWIQITFNGQKSIDEIDVFTVQDNYNNPVDPTTNMTFTQYGITAFDVQYWDGAKWVTVPGGSISGNNLVWRTVNFTAVTTDRIRVMVNNALASYSRVTEIEAYGP
jgi:subtilisin